MNQHFFDLAIVGAGAAGMTAAIYALRAKKSVVLFEASAYGGQILSTSKIENYPGILEISGADFAKTLRAQVKKFGGHLLSASVETITPLEDSAPLFKIITDDGEFFSRAVILANGSRERHLDLPDEEHLIGHGVSYCASCDGAFYQGKTVAVYGGGNTALYSALYLANLAKKVYLVARSGFRAEKHLVSRAESTPNIELLRHTQIATLLGDRKLSGVKLVSTLSRASAPTKLPQVSKSTPATPPQSSAELPLDALFVSIGREANNSRFRSLVDLDDDGYIRSGEDCKTKTPGVFVAGDSRAKTLHQLVTATSDGAIAATAAVEFLNTSSTQPS